MSAAIWKYPLSVSDNPIIEMQSRAEILHVGHQGDGVVLWAKVRTEVGPVRRKFTIYGTGQAMAMDEGAYVGTVQMPNGLVWHVFDRGEQSNG